MKKVLRDDVMNQESFWRNKDGQFKWYKVIGIIFAVVIVIIFLSPIVTIPAGHRGVVLTFGAVEQKIMQEGLNFRIPVAQSVALMEVRTQKYSAIATSASKDLQDVSTEVALNYHLDAGRANEIYQRLGIEYGDRIIAPAIQESVKASTAQFNAEELISERPTVKVRIEEALRDRLASFGIILEIVSITDFKFSEQFTRAIEDKVTAQQQALKAQNDLVRIQIEAEQKEAQAIGEQKANIAKATGEAEAIRIIDEQLKRSPNYISWLTAQKWDGQLPLATGGAVPFLNIPAGD